MGANAANAGVTPGTGFDAQAAARAGTGGGLSLFHPSHPTGGALSGGGGFGTGGMQSFADLKAGFAQDRAEMAKQRAVAEQVRQDEYKKASAPAITKDDYTVAAPEYQYYGDSMFGMLPTDYKDPGNPAKSTWTDRTWDFGGVDKGWEQYEADYQKSMNADNLTPFSWEWIQRKNMEALQGTQPGMDPIHSIWHYDDNNIWKGDERDPYGYGSDYGRWYDRVYGEGALAKQANLFAKGYAEDDPAFAGYEQGYGQIDWNDANQVEDLFRRMNMGGTKTAQMQDTIAQNKRTDMTEAGIMMAASMGMGALAAPAAASIGYGGTLGASTAAESALYGTLANQMTADALARMAISGAGQYG